MCRIGYGLRMPRWLRAALVNVAAFVAVSLLASVLGIALMARR
jgi:hypothetical protein